MKSRNVNNASKKTQKLIKGIFAEMLGEKRELGKISVSELCARANISRGAFYSHYDDIYGVAEDYENELIDAFFTNANLLKLDNLNQFLELFFKYITENDKNYRLLCRSNDFIFAAKRLSDIACNKFMETVRKDTRIKDKRYVELETKIFIEGLLCEYVRSCRNYTDVTLDDLYEYTKVWLKEFFVRRCN